MRGFVDLHSHWVASIDDGVRTEDDGIKLLRALYDVGFSTVVATPHMRPGMFDNDRTSLTRAYEAMEEPVARAREQGNVLPVVYLSSEHFLDDIVFHRLLEGEGLPYPGGGAALDRAASAGLPRPHCAPDSRPQARLGHAGAGPPRAVPARLR